MKTPSWMPQLPLLPKLMVRLSATDECALYDWLHQYAIDAVKAYRKSLKPVAWINDGLYEVLQEQGALRIGTIYTEKPNDSWLPLYRLDDQP